MKKSDTKIFENHTFFVTGKVPVDKSLLKNVAAACGAKVRRLGYLLKVGFHHIPPLFRSSISLWDSGHFKDTKKRDT